MEFYAVKNGLVTQGNYTNIDQALIVSCLMGKGYTVETMELTTLVTEIPNDDLACYEDNGEFYIQNENGDRICTLKVFVELFDRDKRIDSTDDNDLELSEDSYEVQCNNTLIEKLNLTEGLKRDINNAVESWIIETNRRNNY